MTHEIESESCADRDRSHPWGAARIEVEVGPTGPGKSVDVWVSFRRPDGYEAELIAGSVTVAATDTVDGHRGMTVTMVSPKLMEHLNAEFTGDDLGTALSVLDAAAVAAFTPDHTVAHNAAHSADDGHGDRVSMDDIYRCVVQPMLAALYERGGRRAVAAFASNRARLARLLAADAATIGRSTMGIPYTDGDIARMYGLCADAESAADGVAAAEGSDSATAGAVETIRVCQAISNDSPWGALCESIQELIERLAYT